MEERERCAEAQRDRGARGFAAHTRGGSRAASLPPGLAMAPGSELAPAQRPSNLLLLLLLLLVAGVGRAWVVGQQVVWPVRRPVQRPDEQGVHCCAPAALEKDCGSAGRRGSEAVVIWRHARWVRGMQGFAATSGSGNPACWGPLPTGALPLALPWCFT